MYCHNLSLCLILKHHDNLKNANIKVPDELFEQLSSSIVTNLNEQIPEINHSQLIIGNSFIYGSTPVALDELESLEQVFNKELKATKLLSHNFVIDNEDIASVSDEKGFQHSTYYLPIFIKDSRKTLLPSITKESLISLTSPSKNIIYNFINSMNIQPICLGYGYNDLLVDTFLNDFESLYLLEDLINKEQIKILVPYEFSFYKKNGVTIALFKSLVSFREAHVKSKTSNSIVDSYLSFTKDFRTGLAILKLQGQPFKILKEPLLRESIIDDTILNNPLLKQSGVSLSDNYIIEKLEGNAKELVEVDNVEIDAYEDVQTGVIGILITWFKNERCILRESVYPTQFDTEDLIDDIKKQVKRKIPSSASLSIKKHDINNESKIMNSLN